MPSPVRSIQTPAKLTTPHKSTRPARFFRKKVKTIQKVDENISRLNDDYFQAQLQELKLKARALRLRKHVILAEEVTSKLARYYILDTYFHSRDENSLLDLVARWQAEVVLLRRLYEKAVNSFTRRQDQATYFTFLCAEHLLLGAARELDLETLRNEVPCPFKGNAWNFILPLAQGRRCLCLCYASYIRAAAEEFGFDDLIYLCRNNNNYSVITIDEHKIDAEPITQADLDSFHIAGVPGYLQSKRVFTLNDEIRLARIVSRLTIQVQDSVIVEITARAEEKPLFSKLNTVLQKQVTYLPALSSECSKTSFWNDEVSLITGIVTRADFRVMYARLLCVGYIYQLESVVDNMLLVHLIYRQRELDYLRWRDASLAWEQYQSLVAHLQGLAINSLDEIYSELMERAREPFSVRAILGAIDLLTAKAKLATK